VNKNLIFGIGAVAIVLGIGGFLLTRGSNQGPISIPLLKKEIKLGQNVCVEFPKEWVTSIINKPIVKTKDFAIKGTYKCSYFFNDKDFVMLGFDELSFETQKKGQGEFGKTITTNDKIPINHFVALSENGLIHDIILEITPNLFFSLDRYPEKVISEDQMIDFAVKVTQRIKNGENQIAAPAVVTTKQDGNADLVNNFFKSVSEGKINEPMYKAMKSVKVLKIEESSKADWNENWQQYMVTLDVVMDPSSANQPIPYYGFEKGENVRFVNLTKQNGQWKIDGLSTGP
jgi:hypothetical protein